MRPSTSGSQSNEIVNNSLPRKLNSHLFFKKSDHYRTDGDTIVSQLNFRNLVNGRQNEIVPNRHRINGSDIHQEDYFSRVKQPYRSLGFSITDKDLSKATNIHKSFQEKIRRNDVFTRPLGNTTKI